MSIGILGQKVGMTRVYDDAGTITPVTVILAEPNAVLQVKTADNDGYAAIQVGAFDQKEHRVTKPELGHFKAAGSVPKKFVGEFRPENGEAKEEFKQGDTLTVTRFKPGQLVDVIGISKGKGFQGPMKKHNFHGQGAAHGSKTHRRNGAIGMRSTPGRIYKNHGMAGHMGDEKSHGAESPHRPGPRSRSCFARQRRGPRRERQLRRCAHRDQGPAQAEGRRYFRQGRQSDEGFQGRQIIMSFSPLTSQDAASKLKIELIDNGIGTQALHETVVAYRANRRAGTHSTKTKATVAGSGKKPWRQKGTGNARAGYRSSPVWSGGGVVFGPHPRDYSKKTNKAVKQLALRKAISSRINAGEVYLIDPITLEKPRTKDLLGKLGDNLEKKTTALLVTEVLDQNLYLASRNHPHLITVTGDQVNAEQLLLCDKIFITDGALAKISARLQK